MKMTKKYAQKLVGTLRGRLSVDEFAREIKATHQTVYNWERGLSIPSPVFQILLFKYAEENQIRIPKLV